jgi:hypothetical protein
LFNFWGKNDEDQLRKPFGIVPADKSGCGIPLIAIAIFFASVGHAVSHIRF